MTINSIVARQLTKWIVSDLLRIKNKKISVLTAREKRVTVSSRIKR